MGGGRVGRNRHQGPLLRNHSETVKSVRTAQLLTEYKLDGLANVTRENTGHDRFAHRAGAALGLAYAMHDAGERMRDVRAQLREAKAFAVLAGL